MLNLAGNVICFMPLGFVLPILSNHRWGFFRITLISALASLCVELVQLVSKLGSCDVDDIILNTCGGMIGYAGFCICKKAYHIYAKHRKKQHKKGKEGFYEQKREEIKNHYILQIQKHPMLAIIATGLSFLSIVLFSPLYPFRNTKRKSRIVDRSRWLYLYHH